MSLSSLPEIIYAEESPSLILAELVARYKTLSGRDSLMESDPAYILLSSIAFIISQQRSVINANARSNFLKLANGAALDHLGALSDTERSPEEHAVTTLQFTLSAVQGAPVVIPAGTRGTADGETMWSTEALATIPAGALSVLAAAKCGVAGEAFNGVGAGKITTLVDPVAYVAGVTNTTVSSGGADEESDDDYRARIAAAPSRFSVAGPRKAYQYFAKSANAGIIDVSVRSPTAGAVEIRPLMFGGEMPGAEILDAVAAACSSEDVRPLTDLVTVLAPGAVAYGLDLTYFVSSEDSASLTAIQAAVDAAVQDYRLWQKGKLGRDINPSQLIKRVIMAGAKRCVVNSPAFATVQSFEVAQEGAVTVTYGGMEDE